MYYCGCVISDKIKCIPVRENFPIKISLPAPHVQSDNPPWYFFAPLYQYRSFCLDYFCLSPNEVTFCDVSVNPGSEKDILTHSPSLDGGAVCHTLKCAVLCF